MADDDYTAHQEIERILKCKPTDFYDILNIDRCATDEDIQKAIKRLLLKIHPDKNDHPKATMACQVVNQAKETLLNPDKRQMYDNGLQNYGGIRRRQPWSTTSDTTSRMNRQTYTFGNNIEGIVYVIIGCLLLLLVTNLIISNMRSEPKACSLHQNGIYRFKRWAPGNIPYYVKEDRRYSRSELDIYEWEIKKQVNELRQQCRQKDKHNVPSLVSSVIDIFVMWYSSSTLPCDEVETLYGI